MFSIFFTASTKFPKSAFGRALRKTLYIELSIQQGASDPRVPVGEAVQMYEAASKAGIPTELILYADEGHGAGRRENQVLMIGHVVRFMNDHLKGSPAPAE